MRAVISRFTLNLICCDAGNVVAASRRNILMAMGTERVLDSWSVIGDLGPTTCRGAGVEKLSRA